MMFVGNNYYGISLIEEKLEKICMFINVKLVK